MRYNATIKYENKSVTVKVTNKELECTMQLPEFLKRVRKTRGHTVQSTHLLTDYPTEDCLKYEEGKERIPRNYLKCFLNAYRLPMRIAQLGYEPERETKSKIAQRLVELRLQNEVSQIIVACELNIARSTYACYETGKNTPDIYTLIKIADYYKVSLDYLVGRY